MLLLEQYIEKRKNEDGLDEFDSSKKIDNIQICINYIFEYFNVYLPMQGAEDRSPKENKLLLKFEHEIRKYSKETQSWLYNIYYETGHKIDMTIVRYLNEQESYFLAYQEHEFRAISYDCYAQIIKKNPFIKNQTEELYRFIKEYHYKKSNDVYNNWKTPDVTASMLEWMENTWVKYKVNLSYAIGVYIGLFYGNQAIWPDKAKVKSVDLELNYVGWDYDFTVKTNRFNIRRFYDLYGNKPFLKGKKKQVEALMLYHCNGKYRTAYEEYVRENPDI